ncbi:energy-coupling factor ABC transporter ATP-binding protein [Halorarum salinum]|uniref:ATP-binding cassette domain-containing protein n=1 Tax=Halorarum salinum TaxID=2743089 RepID=A0A7D5Q7P2_9EURY|nr:ABC transporter ATP-binding protein [Halobaculum salinum]QLG60357.1 ATP-binding cassette domain-containing protein [Halobaculum salinum]
MTESRTGKHPALVVDGVEFGYVSDTTVLHDVDLSIDSGEFVTIIGQNGSGKSTLVKNVVGLLKPDQGSVTIYDDDGTPYETTEQPMNVLARYVGFVFQNPDDQIFHTSVQKELTYGLKNIGVPEAERQERIESVLDAVGLSTDGSQNPFNLGKGQRQRLAIAAVLVMRPQTIIVDEPTTGQDRKESKRIMEILQEYNDEGHTIIAITHDIALAAEYTDRVVAIRDGDVIADGPPERVFLDEQNLKETNIRPPQITQLGAALNDRLDADILEEMWLTTDDAFEDTIDALSEGEAVTKSSRKHQ